MAKDNAIRDQKVFVRLGAVLELQKMYSEAISRVASSGNLTPNDRENRARHLSAKQTFERTIRTLELPIELPIGV